METTRDWIAKAGSLLNRREVRLVLAAGLLLAIGAQVDRNALLLHLRGFDPVFGVAMTGVFLVLVVLFALRWWLIAGKFDIRLPFPQFVRALWISQCVGELGPPLLVGELARFQVLRSRSDPWALAASQAVDRFSGKIVLLSMCAALLPVYQGLYGDFPLLRIAAMALILITAVAAMVLALRGFRTLAGVQLREVLAVVNPRRGLAHYGLSLLIQSLLTVNFALAAAGLGVRDAATLLMVGPLLLLGVGSLPGLVSDWGKREATAIVLLVPLGLNSEQSLAVSLIYGLLHLVVALPGALLLARGRRRRGGTLPGKYRG